MKGANILQVIGLLACFIVHYSQHNKRFVEVLDGSPAACVTRGTMNLDFAVGEELLEDPLDGVDWLQSCVAQGVDTRAEDFHGPLLIDFLPWPIDDHHKVILPNLVKLVCHDANYLDTVFLDLNKDLTDVTNRKI